MFAFFFNENKTNESKPIIWFVIIVVIVGFVGIQLFTTISQYKLEIFGMADPESSSLSIDGQVVKHATNNRNNEFDYMNTFLGIHSSSSPFSIVPGTVYNRHIQTAEELKGKVLSDNIYKSFFNGDLSENDKILFLSIMVLYINSI